MRHALCLTLFLFACGGSGHGGDAGTDIGAPAPDSLCTTTACAASPCTVGCTFTSTASATCEAKISTKVVQACEDFCGLLPGPGGGLFGCWHYEYDQPECNTCGYHGECYILDDPGIDFTTGGAICAVNCERGGPTEDASVTCDLSTSDGPVDGG